MYTVNGTVYSSREGVVAFLTNLEANSRRERYKDYLNYNYPPVHIEGETFSPSQVLKNCCGTTTFQFFADRHFSMFTAEKAQELSEINHFLDLLDTGEKEYDYYGSALIGKGGNSLYRVDEGNLEYPYEIIEHLASLHSYTQAEFEQEYDSANSPYNIGSADYSPSCVLKRMNPESYSEYFVGYCCDRSRKDKQELKALLASLALGQSAHWKEHTFVRVK